MLVDKLNTTLDGEFQRRVERRRGRTPATTFAARHHAGTAEFQIARYRQLVARGVRTVFLALPDLADAAQIEQLAPITAAFAAAG